MKIVQIHKTYWPRDGASIYCLRLSQLLQNAGHIVIPFAMQDSRNLDTPYEKYFVSPLDVSTPDRLSVSQKLTAVERVLLNREAVEKITALLDEVQPDVVHIHNIYHHISPAILAVIHKRGIPVVMTLHDYHLLSPNYTLFHHGAVHEEDARGLHLSCLGNRCVKNAFLPSLLGVLATNLHRRWYRDGVNRFITPSHFSFALHEKYGWDMSRFSEIPHPIDTTRDVALNPDDGTVLYAGRLSPEKGVDILIHAAKATPDISYVIAGDGPEAERLQRLVKELGVANVRFVGFIDSVRLKDMVARARLTVLPSRWYEVAPLSLLTSLNLGTLAIGSHIGGIPEVLPKEFLVQPNDPTALAEKIREWCGKDQATRDMWRKQLAAQVRVQHDPHTHLEHILSVYQDAMTKRV